MGGSLCYAALSIYYGKIKKKITTKDRTKPVQVTTKDTKVYPLYYIFFVGFITCLIRTD